MRAGLRQVLPKQTTRIRRSYCSLAIVNFRGSASGPQHMAFITVLSLLFASSA